jgi:hypothetical protein
MQVGHKKHEHCSHALEEDAPKVLGHGSNSEWAVMATERRTQWSRGVPVKRRERNSTWEFDTLYAGIQREGVYISI